MNQAIPFTVTHENILNKCAERLDQHTIILDEHSSILAKNTKAIERNSKAIEQNSKAIKHNTKILQKHSDEIRRLGVLLEQRESKLDAILEIVTHINKRFQRQDEMGETIENHEHRISAVELTIKQRGATRD